MWAWGKNTWGQLGDGTRTSRGTVARVGEDDDWDSFSCGYSHVAAIKSDGTLWAWGYNGQGQVGDGTTIGRSAPSRVGTDTDWVAVASGGYHTVALKRDGSLWAWGRNTEGQLGDGTTTNRPTPSRVGTSTDWATPSAGLFQTFAIKTDGTLWAWGDNDYGQLGDGTTIDRPAPSRVGTSTEWAAVSTWRHTIGLKRDGSVLAWGDNSFGQYGNGTTTSRSTPVLVAGKGSFVSVRAGDLYTMGLGSNGSLGLAGANFFGQLGDGTMDSRSTLAPLGQAWEAPRPYSDSIQMVLDPVEGTKTVSVQYVNASGDPLTLADEIVLDTAAPSTTIGGIPSSHLATGPVTVSLSASDAVCGVGAIEYVLDSIQPTSSYAMPIQVTAPGAHTVAYWARDMAGNTEDARIATFTISGTYEETDPDILYEGTWWRLVPLPAARAARGATRRHPVRPRTSLSAARPSA